MIYCAGWLFLVAISLAASIVALVWALRAGQFSDQERARYLPLGKDLLSEPIVAASRAKSRVHTVSMCVITATAFIAFAAALTLSLYHR
jgi:cbb3-type cytochrome oxidase maturation protein